MGTTNNRKRKQITKCGFKTKSEAYTAGQKAYDEFINGVTSIECNMLYGDYLDYWMKWFFYLYYPLHLIIIGIIRILMYGNISLLFN